MFDWNDLKFLIAVGRHGSTLAAARHLKVNQTTVARRLDALEGALGVRLFERGAGGYALTARGHEALDIALELAAAAKAIEDRAAAWRREASGVLRVTTTELLATGILAPLLSDLRLTHPGLRIDLHADDHRLDLRHGEADVALRLGVPADEPGIVGRKVGESHWGIYCAEAYRARHGVPEAPKALPHHALIGGSDDLARLPALAWLAEMAPEAPVVARCNSVPNLVAAVRAGIGVAPLPLFVAGEDPGLVRCLPDRAFAAPIWLLYREAQRHTPHLRVFVDALAARLRETRHRFEGRASPAQPTGLGKPT